jgi:hypothetical protein
MKKSNVLVTVFAVACLLLLCAERVFDVNYQLRDNVGALILAILLTVTRAIEDRSCTLSSAKDNEVVARRRGRLLSISGCALLALLVLLDLVFGLGHPRHEIYSNLELLILIFIMFAYIIGGVTRL